MKILSKLALVLALVMLITAFGAGCGGSTATTGEGSSTVEATAAADASAAASQEPAQDKKEMEISVALWDLAEFGNDEIGKKIQDALKIKLTIFPMDWGNSTDQAQLWAASNNLPDITGTYTVEQDITRFYGWYDNGLTRDIPEDMLAKHPDIKKLFDDNDIVNSVKQIKGKYLFISRPFSIKKNYKFDQGMGFYFRKDWMKNVGIEKEPQTMDEFYDMLKKFTQNDPDGNKQNDTYGMTMSHVPMASFFWFGINPEAWVQEDGQWIPGYFSKKCVNALKFWSKVYHEKLIDPEFATNNGKQTIQKFSQNKFGVVSKNVDDQSIYTLVLQNWARTNLSKMDAKKAADAVGILSPMTQNAGEQPYWTQIMDTSGSEISKKVDDEKLERIFELYEYLMKPDVLSMLRYGMEGKEYLKNGDNIVPLTNPDTGLPYTVTTVYPSANILELVTWDADNAIEGPIIPQPIKDMGKAMRDKLNPLAQPQNFAVRFMSTPAKDKAYVDYSAGFDEIVIKGGDVENNFLKWVEQGKKQGMAQAIQEVTEQAQKLGIK